MLAFVFRIIKRVGLNLEIPGGTRVIDATGKLVMPG
jgi:dihydroorotase-like cyclic amidohydrolase